MPDNRSAIYQLLEQLQTQRLVIRINASTFNNGPAEAAVATIQQLCAQLLTQLATNSQVNTGQLAIVQWPGSPELPRATQGQAYSFQFQAQGGAAPYRWQLAAGGWPAGVTLDPNTGVLSGTCLAFPGGDFNGVIEVIDSAGGVDQSAYDIRIN